MSVSECEQVIAAEEADGWSVRSLGFVAPGAGVVRSWGGRAGGVFEKGK